MVNIYDTANELARQLKETQEFQALTEAFDEVKKDNNGETFKLFKQFEAKNVAMQKKSQQGVQLDKDEVSEMQNLATKVTAIDSVKNLMQKEQAVNQMLQQLNNTITSPLQDLYHDAMPDDADESDNN